jgi:hypothetical protein
LAAKRFKVDSSSIYKWRKNEDKLKIKMLWVLNTQTTDRRVMLLRSAPPR